MIVFLLISVLVLPVAAQQEPKITVRMSCPGTACVGQPVSCTITSSYTGPEGKIAVFDFYPDSVRNIVLSSPGLSYPKVNEAVWLFEVFDKWSMTETINMTPTKTGAMENVVKAVGGAVLNGNRPMVTRDTVTTRINVAQCQDPVVPKTTLKSTPELVPEFPDIVMPIALILGLLGTVFYIRGARGH